MKIMPRPTTARTPCPFHYLIITEDLFVSFLKILPLAYLKFTMIFISCLLNVFIVLKLKFWK